MHNAVTVPNAALQTGSPGSFVYAVQPDSTVAVRAVKLGVADAGKTQVVSGLALGDRVVVDGADRLKDGAHVVLPGSKPQAGAPGGGTAHHRHRSAGTDGS